MESSAIIPFLYLHLPPSVASPGPMDVSRLQPCWPPCGPQARSARPYLGALTRAPVPFRGCLPWCLLGLATSHLSSESPDGEAISDCPKKKSRPSFNPEFFSKPLLYHSPCVTVRHILLVYSFFCRREDQEVETVLSSAPSPMWGI